VLSCCADPFVETVVDDVHLAADAPPRPRQSARRIDHLAVWFVELDAKIDEDRVPEPCRVIDRAVMQVGKFVDTMCRHETA
jgi:hypothetical protein